ncbi:DUF3619 family protein [Rhodoferax sp.]|uniref:DUF3619 family protein n=1 Tax=Rhodoferax sp. TaxID=50421 RepID=UPI003420FB65
MKFLLQGDSSVLPIAHQQERCSSAAPSGSYASAGEAKVSQRPERFIQEVLASMSAGVNDLPQGICQRLSQARTKAIANKRD